MEKGLAGLYRALRRVERLCEGLSARPEDRLEAVLGIVGGASVGHARRIQRILRRLFGAEISGSEEALRLLSLGVPPERALEGVRASFRRARFIETVAAASASLRRVLEDLVDLEEVEGEVEEASRRDLSAAEGNPLQIPRILGGLASSCSRIMPSRSPESLAVQALRLIPRSVFEELFGGLEKVSEASLGILRPRIAVRISDREDLDLASHEPESKGHRIVEILGACHEIHSSIRKTSRPYVRGEDERILHLLLMTPQIPAISRRLGVDPRVEEIFRRSSRGASRPHPGVEVLRGVMVLDADRCRASMGRGISAGCEGLLKYLGLHRALGTGGPEILGSAGPRVRLAWKISLPAEKP